MLRRIKYCILCILVRILYSEIASVDLGVAKRALGSAVYPHVAACFNHSCDPNTAPVTLAHSLNQVTVAARRIGRGEQISHVYQVGWLFKVLLCR